MSYQNNAWNQRQNQGENAPRRPNVTTESRVLNIIKQNTQNEQLEGTSTTGMSHGGGGGEPRAPGQQTNQPLTLPEMPSQLSVNAKEFVPRSQMYSQEVASLSASAAEFVPRAGEDYSVYDYENYSSANYMPDNVLTSLGNLRVEESSGYTNSSRQQGNSRGDPIVERFNYALYVLNMNPGNMKDYLQPICSLIESGSPEDSQNTMNAMVEGLFEQSILEPNFRYTGARICQFLNSNLKGNTQFSGFYKVFMRRCQQEYEKRNELINGSSEDQSRLMGLAMFMAEIFLNVEIEQADGSVSRPSFLPKTLVDFVHTLLSHPTELEVKCCCQLLKLSGALIEDVAKESPELCGHFEDIFTQLATLKTRSELPDSTRVLVGSVIQLKEHNWNRTSGSPPKKSMFPYAMDQATFQHPLQQEPPVFYTQTGDICTGTEAGFPEEESRDFNSYVLNEEEEAAFLEWQAEQQGGMASEQAGTFNDTGYDSYHLEEIPDEGGMGEELEAAFEEFLQEQGQSSSQYQPSGPSQQHSSQGLGFPPQQPYQQSLPPHHQPGFPMYQGPPQVPYNYAAAAARPHQQGGMMYGGMNPASHAPGSQPPPQQGYPPYGNDRYHFTKR